METLAAAHSTLASRVSDGTLRLYSVIGLPRANGTALSIALTQSPSIDGQLNEAFTHSVARPSRYDRPRKDSRSFEDGCRHIVERVNLLASRKTVTLVLHDHAKDLSEHEFRTLVPLIEHFVFVTREPIKNVLSRSTRLVNELFSEGGAARISHEHALMLTRTPAALEQFAREHPDLILPHKMTGFLKLGGYEAARVVFIQTLHAQLMTDWDNVARFVEIMRTEQPRERWSMFDGDWLYNEPGRRFRWLAGRMRIEYTGAMVSGWTKGVGDDFHCIVSRRFGDRNADNAWNGPARSSRGIEEKPGSARGAHCTVNDFPAELRNALDRAQRVYSEFAAILQRSLDEQ